MWKAVPSPNHRCGQLEFPKTQREIIRGLNNVQSVELVLSSPSLEKFGDIRSWIILTVAAAGCNSRNLSRTFDVTYPASIDCPS